MRQKHPSVSLGNLCALFGLTRQAYYEASARDKIEPLIKSALAEKNIEVTVYDF
jgi:hypothetical protein